MHLALKAFDYLLVALTIAGRYSRAAMAEYGQCYVVHTEPELLREQQRRSENKHLERQRGGVE